MEGVVGLLCVLLVFSPVVVIAALDLARQRSRAQAYREAVASDPTDWVAIVTGAPAPRRHAGPVLYDAPVQWGWRTSNSVIAFDDELFVVRRLDGDQRFVIGDHAWTPPAYSEGGSFQQPRLVFGSMTFIEKATLIAEWLAYFGWPISHPPPFTSPGGPRPRWPLPPPAAAGTSAHPRPPSNPPLARPHRPPAARSAPSRSAAQPPTREPVPDEIEFGVDTVGPAISNWLDPSDLDDIE